MRAIPEKAANEILQYLATRPWVEVNAFMNVLQQSKTLEDAAADNGQRLVPIETATPRAAE